jgi:hypothetical protein
MRSDAASLERLIDAYCAAWSEPDAGRRDAILAEVWADDATYTDPRGRAAGRSELSALIAAILAGRPGAKVVRTSAVDAHHGVARFAWRVVQADGAMLPEGIDFAEVGGDGKLARITGFFGPLATADARS